MGFKVWKEVNSTIEDRVVVEFGVGKFTIEDKF